MHTMLRSAIKHALPYLQNWRNGARNDLVRRKLCIAVVANEPTGAQQKMQLPKRSTALLRERCRYQCVLQSIDTAQVSEQVETSRRNVCKNVGFGEQ